MLGAPAGSSFEVFGVDMLVDTDYRPWLVEVNAVPSLARKVSALLSVAPVPLLRVALFAYHRVRCCAECFVLPAKCGTVLVLHDNKSICMSSCHASSHVCKTLLHVIHKLHLAGGRLCRRICNGLS